MATREDIRVLHLQKNKVLALIFLIVSAELSGVAAKLISFRGPRQLRNKRDDSPPVVDEIAKILEEKARFLSLQSFNDDPYLLQSVDRVNSITKYRSPQKSDETDTDVVYEKSGIDKDKDIVVLSAQDDKLKIKGHKMKNTYVVLRRNPNSISPAYYASYAYVRNATNYDKDAVEIAGYKKFIEWDVWEDRSVKHPVIWSTCSSSPFVPCGFNADALSKAGLTLSRGPPKQLGSLSAGGGGGDDSGNVTKPNVESDDQEFLATLDNYDYFDDMNIDLVKGRGLKVADSAGTLGGSSAQITCHMVGMFGGGCGGSRHKKTIIIKAAPPVYAIGVQPPNAPRGPPPGPAQLYLPLGTPNLPPIPHYLDPLVPQMTYGTFYPDNRQISPVDGHLIPFGPGKPYLFQGANPQTFGAKLPADKGTTGVYAPPGAQYSYHGIMLPISPGSGFFLPDGLAYPSSLTPATGQPRVHGYSIPGYPGHPDIFMPDSDMTNPLRRSTDQNQPLKSKVDPDPPNVSNQPPKPGQLLQNKLPMLFLPDDVHPYRSTFTDDPHQKRPQPGWLIPQPPGLPETFIPDNESEVKKWRPPPYGMMAPHPPAPQQHGLLFPNNPGFDPLFIPDNAGGQYRFSPSDSQNPTSEGGLYPANPGTANDYVPTLGPVPPKPNIVPGVMTPLGNPTKQPLPGNLIINRASAPYPFLPNGVGCIGELRPNIPGRPPIPGIWTPGFPGFQDEFIPLEEPVGGIPVGISGNFIPKNSPQPYPATTGRAQRPGGPPSITNAPPGQRPPPCMGAASAGNNRFVPDPGQIPAGPIPMNLVNPNPQAGQPLAFNPNPNARPRGTAQVQGLPQQKGKVVPDPPGGPANFIPDPPGTLPGFFTPSVPPNSPPRAGFVGPPAPPKEGEPTAFTPDYPGFCDIQQPTPGTLSTAGSPPARGVLHPNEPGVRGPCPFRPFVPSIFYPDKNPAQVNGAVPPNLVIPNGDPNQQVPFFADNPMQVPVGSRPQRGRLHRDGSQDAPGLLLPPTQPGGNAIFTPDPMNSIPSQLIPDTNPYNPADGWAIVPYDPNQPIVFKPDEKPLVPPGMNKGKLRLLTGNPTEKRGMIQNPNPQDPNTVLFHPFKPVIFTPAALGSTAVPGAKEEPANGRPMLFYPDDPAQLTQQPQPGTLSAPQDPSFQPVSGMLRPDYPPPAYSFTPFPRCTFTPDGGGPPAQGGVELPTVPGQNPVFYPDPGQPLSPSATPGSLSGPALAQPLSGLLKPPQTAGGGRPLEPFPSGYFFPDSNPAMAVPCGVQSLGPGPNDPSKLYQQSAPLNPGTGTLRHPQKGDQHGTASPTSPGGPLLFTPDAPGAGGGGPGSGLGGGYPGGGGGPGSGQGGGPQYPGRPCNFFPEAGGGPIPGLFNDQPQPHTFRYNNPNQAVTQPTRGSLQLAQPPGMPMSSGVMGPHNNNVSPWNPDTPATFYPTEPQAPPVGGYVPAGQTGDKPFYPQQPQGMPPGLPKGTLTVPGEPDQRGTMMPNPVRTPQPSWIFKPDAPDSVFTPNYNPNSRCSGSLAKASYPGGAAPFYPQACSLQPGPQPGRMSTNGGPGRPGNLLPPSSAGQPHMWEEASPALFYKDADPTNPLAGNPDRSPDPAAPIPFAPVDPGKFGQAVPQGEFPTGWLKETGQPDIHGYMEPAGRPGAKATFYPDPPGSQPAVFIADRNPNAQAEGIYSPNQIFRVINDPQRVLGSTKEHGQLILKVDGVTEVGTMEPVSLPQKTYRWSADPSGTSPAWFYPDNMSQKTIRGLYRPPLQGEHDPTFLPNDLSEAPKIDEHGKIKKDIPANSPPETGTLKVAPFGVPNPFVQDSDRVSGIDATFYADIQSAAFGESLDGSYLLPSQPTSPGTFKPAVPEHTVLDNLPCPGNMIPVGYPQIHGVLKEPAAPGLPYVFVPDGASVEGIPEYEVQLVPQGNNAAPQAGDVETSSASVRGEYFKGLIDQDIFVPYTGTNGIFVSNDMPPLDPKVQCIYATFTPRQKSQDGVVTPQSDSSGSQIRCNLNPAQIPPGSRGTFYPTGSIANGIPGQWLPNGNSPGENIFRANSGSQSGTWKSPQTSSNGCFMFDEKAQIIPFSMDYVKNRDAQFNKPPVPMTAFNFQGSSTNQFDLFMEIKGGQGKFVSPNAVFHGNLVPEDSNPVSRAIFTPDHTTLLENMVRGGPIGGTFEQDDTPSAQGVTPNNGVRGTISFAGGQFVLTFTNPGRKGQLTPGKKPVPGFYVFCFGLVQNAEDSKSKEILSMPVNRGRGFGKKHPGGPSMAGRSFGPIQQSIATAPEYLVTSENMGAKAALNQNFGAYLSTYQPGESRADGSGDIHAAQLQRQREASGGNRKREDVEAYEEERALVVRQQPSLSAVPDDLRAQLEAIGARPVTSEEANRVLTPEVLQRIGAQLGQSAYAGQFTPSPGGGRGRAFLSDRNEISGFAYKSTSLTPIFIPTRGTIGIYFWHPTSNITQFIGTFINGRDGSSATIEAEKLPQVLAAVKNGDKLRGVFAPFGPAGQGGIEITEVVLKGEDSVELKLGVPGIKGGVKNLGLGFVDSSSQGEIVLGYTAANTSLAPALVMDSVHGSYYQSNPKEIFVPDFPGISCTFFANGLPVRGTYYPPVGISPGIFWSEGSDLANLLPIGKGLTLSGKIVPDEVLGETAPQDNSAIIGSLKSGTIPRAYIFKEETSRETGYISKQEASSLGPKVSRGRALLEDSAAQFQSDNRIDIEDHPGWRTQYEVIVPNITLKYDDDVFYGFGNCPHRSLGPEDLAKASSDDDIAEFYVGLLRTYCLPSVKPRIGSLMREGFLKIKNKLIVVPDDCKYLKQPKLSVAESEKLSYAFEMSVFTLTYADEIKKGSNPESLVAPDGKRITRSVKFLVDMSILAIKLQRELSQQHSVRLSRNLITTLATAGRKLLQDYNALKNCGECGGDRDIIHNDAMQLMGLVQYIIHGLPSVLPGEKIRDSYEQFYKSHKDLIHKKAEQFSI